MSNESFGIFRTYLNVAEANEASRVLKAAGIEHQVLDNSPAFDITMTGGNTLEHQVQLKVATTDFERASEAFKTDARAVLAEVEPDYYLYEFTDDELYELLVKEDEWGELDVQLAAQLLADRGKPVNKDVLHEARQQRLEELRQPDDGQTASLVAGYVFAFFGGLIGIIIGWYFWKFRKTLHNGEQVYSNSERLRNHGHRLVIISSVVLILTLVLALI